MLYKKISSLQMLIIILSVFFFIVITYFLYRHLLKLLKRIKKTVSQLEKYQNSKFDIDLKEENIGKTHLVSDSITDNRFVLQKYTELEYALQVERERLQNLMTIFQGIIHDLKSPLYQMMLENEVFLREQQLTTETQVVLHYNIQRLDIIMQQITEILTLLNSDMREMIEVKNQFDFIEVAKKIRLGFVTLLEEKGLWMTSNMPESLVVQINKVTTYLILHNMLTNAVQYALVDSEIILTIYTEANNLHIICENEANLENVQKIKQNQGKLQPIFTPYVHNEYLYSTGNGIYLMQELTKISAGTFEIIFKSSSITVHVTLPLH